MGRTGGIGLARSTGGTGPVLDGFNDGALGLLGRLGSWERG